MAQSIRRPESLGGVNLKPQGEKTRTGYFCNVKSRLGSKLPAGVSQPPRFAKPPWETQPQSQIMPNTVGSGQRKNEPVVRRPLDHIPHIRNPKLRQYYLQGTAWELSNTAVTVEEPLDGSTSSTGLPGDTVFSVSSQFSCKDGPLGEKSKTGQSFSHNSTRPSSDTPIVKEQLVSKRKDASVSGKSSRPELDSNERKEVDADRCCLDSAPAQPQSPSPEAEYDKLLDVEAVPLPDGHLCLLALPPECCQGERPEPMLYLKLFCHHITDGKGVVSGILVVTSNKIFFDPSKTHPLVTEHGFENYLLSFTVDSLASISFFSDSSHVHFNTSLQRKGKTKNIFQKLKVTKSKGGSVQGEKQEELPPALVSAAPSVLPSPSLGLTKEEETESTDMAAVEGGLDSGSLEVQPEDPLGSLAVLSSAATFCCGGPEAELPDAEKSAESETTDAPQRPSAGSLGGLMFVRLRVQSSATRKKSSAKTLSRRDTWLALSQERSDELRSYLKLWRPDLCLLEGEEEGEADHDEEEFVLVEDKGEEEEEEEEEDEETLQTLRGSGDDWEMVLMEENKEKSSVVIDKEPEGIINVVENSQILEASHVRELSQELPPRTVGRTWQLAYSTSRHGASLKSLYRKLGNTDSPVLIVIKDALDELFGAFLSEPLKPSEKFYGTGETFLFMLHPRFKCFRWTGENSFFIKGDLDCFAVGGGRGHFGLWVDENLYLGRSSPCYTFNNCSLSETDDFRIMELEVWTFS
ncbi:PREDICTED: nuclear receptor coactivator 7-like isoform X3 [Cyprinodon variegatus]|uniref:nuclear receptor coactivator 7-like isoform X3 n=1 Tax=Cyprinodon variegatus TaxID=28743 RepID=UPI000742C2D8|nr:PREDICTED: nuclear receptor coactivator 7-like isoform X3 [Cyprinodon variegatus]